METIYVSSMFCFKLHVGICSLIVSEKGQIVMARCLWTSISETTCLVGCSHAAVVSTYEKSGARMAKRRTVIQSCVVHSSLMPEGSGNCCALFHSATNHQQLQQWWQGQCVTAYNSSQPSANWPAKPMTQPGPHANCTTSPTTHEMGPRSLRLDHGWLEESGLVWRIKIPSASRLLPTEAMSPGCTVGRTQASSDSVIKW